jgi:hypothetical protein
MHARLLAAVGAAVLSIDGEPLTPETLMLVDASGSSSSSWAG